MSLVNGDNESLYSNTFEVCDDCQNLKSDLSFCNLCQCIFCTECWEKQSLHRKKAFAPGGVPHEKAELELARRIQDVFSTAVSDSDLERLHVEDHDTAWFGMPCRLFQTRF
jgi:hypothetical protein